MQFEVAGQSCSSHDLCVVRLKQGRCRGQLIPFPTHLKLPSSIAQASFRNLKMDKSGETRDEDTLDDICGGINCGFGHFFGECGGLGRRTARKSYKCGADRAYTGRDHL